jgi:hypothetical protein
MPLAFIATHPKMAYELGLDQDYVKRAKSILQRKGLFVGPEFKPPGTEGQPLLFSMSPKARKRKEISRTPPEKKKDFQRFRGGKEPKKGKSAQPTLF